MDLKDQKVISTRKFLATFAQISKPSKVSPTYFLIVKNGEEAGIYIPQGKISEFIKKYSHLEVYDQEESTNPKKEVSLKESFDTIKFKGDKDLSKNYKKILYN